MYWHDGGSGLPSHPHSGTGTAAIQFCTAQKVSCLFGGAICLSEAAHYILRMYPTTAVIQDVEQKPLSILQQERETEMEFSIRVYMAS